MVLFSIFINGLDDGAEYTLSKFVDDENHWEEWQMSQSAVVTWRGTLTGWEKRNPMKFNTGNAKSCIWGYVRISLLIGFISVNNSPWRDYSAYSFFQIVTMCDLVMILFFYIIYIFRIYRKLTCVSWPLAEFLHYLIGTILLLIGSIVAAAKSYNITGLVAGATFGFLATILCVLSMWSSYKVSCITQSTSKYHG
ncbi:PREDICTED: CKLF-like MARVEL transmembrane domain-containing protein 7 [Acanthisitta chloris]|uniref:CKLF-like MARVEL transmembrane domain-containing protein 7 n=1 Tax=Acanthisitta chloris TaxID=57068 RepID=UPI0004F0EDCD|nr:PREDICTED: CKLF-like MARVEL transmembrane domain-containing protein 7 [Acanthisitta chloris]